jgi:hypothetical protein
MTIDIDKLQQIWTSLRLNYKSWLLIFISLFMLPDSSSILNKFFTFFIMLLLCYWAHYFAHLSSKNTTVHSYHHNNNNLFSHFIQILLEFYTIIFLIPFTYVSNIQVFNPWVIIFVYIFYSTVHNINYSVFHVNNTHEAHHACVETNIGPDICDIIFDTKGGTPIENTDHYIINIVCSLLIVIFLNKIWVHSNDDYKAVYQMIFEIIFATSTFLLLFVMWTLSEDENDKVINDHIETITYLLQKKQ